ncbi:MAG TPA: type II toxin-antitoxin system VapC family toxin [Candidatus Acidoferrales bacterium]|nr:type II toxin-antitoxin system VapC family toxin [Candidatus Acidoferrales bacterium]
MILDTNALSAAAEGNANIAGILAGLDRVALPVIVIGEYRYGIAQSRHAARYRRWLDDLIANCDVLDVTEQTTHQYATISTELRSAGKPIPSNDVWIAALCRQHSLGILSQDHHFDAISGIRRFGW